MSITRHITLPAGFAAAGVACGIKQSGKKDLAIIAAERDAAAAVLTTQNQVVGAPVLWCRKLLPRGYGRVRGIVVNSGCSNACTGKAGLKDAGAMARQTAQQLGCDTEKVLVASTGVIGHRLEMAKVRAGIDAAAKQLGTKKDSAVLNAIMTTDTRQKHAVVRVNIGGKNIAIAGIVKGSGMVAPSMATMIAIITTDAAVAPAALHKALTAAATASFNTITIDSDTSTSDTVVVLASGAAGNKNITHRTASYQKFAVALAELCRRLACAVVADGEGANKLVEITVRGARNASEAVAAAKSVANSPLLKCAIHGGDPNWGRIVMAIGKSAAKVVPEKLSVKIGGTTVFAGGRGQKFNLKKVAKYMAGKKINILCDLRLGKGCFTALTCDLSRRYVTINADYHT